MTGSAFLRLIVVFFLALVLTRCSSVYHGEGQEYMAGTWCGKPRNERCVVTRRMVGFPWYYKADPHSTQAELVGLTKYQGGLLPNIAFYGVLLWLLGNALDQGVLLVRQRRWPSVPVLILVLTCSLVPPLLLFLLVPQALCGELLFYYTFLWLSTTALFQSVLLVRWLRRPLPLGVAPVLTFLVLPLLLFFLFYFLPGPMLGRPIRSPSALLTTLHLYPSCNVFQFATGVE